MKKYILTIFVLAATSLAHGSLPPPCGWEIMNIHEKNPGLEGFAIQQYPDWDKDKKVYRDGHPYIVFFKFKSGMDHIVFYSASGQVMGGEWTKLPDSHWEEYKLRGVADLYHECRGHHSLGAASKT
ncbi:hypothetical protein [Microbulbifer sp. HZ11]|uniref:hypothetical protein n=1 Tax=Microbulbifer sp. HZ11 TaxID=1453501 RepID=UPI0012DFB5C3|nr:hypothetical protein [Microbulbifer sp. HZ11]